MLSQQRIHTAPVSLSVPCREACAKPKPSMRSHSRTSKTQKAPCNPKFQVLEFDRCFKCFTFVNYKLQSLKRPRLQCRMFQCSQSNVGSNSASEPWLVATGWTTSKAMTPRLALEIVGVSAWDSGAHGADWRNQCNPHGQTNLAAHAQTNLTISYDSILFHVFTCFACL